MYVLSGDSIFIDYSCGLTREQYYEYIYFQPFYALLLGELSISMDIFLFSLHFSFIYHLDIYSRTHFLYFSLKAFVNLKIRRTCIYVGILFANDVGLSISFFLDFRKGNVYLFKCGDYLDIW